jgi:beta-ketoacyl-acyl-carrier-protein synthase II
MNRKRVVVTGLGAITPLGSSVSKYWDGLVAGTSGIGCITRFDASQLPCQIAGEIPDFVPEDYMERKETRRTGRNAQIALAAAIQAVQDAGLPERLPDPERAGIAFGTGMGGLDLLDENVRILRSKGHERVSPFALPGSIPNLAAFIISQRLGIIGPSITVTTACTTGTQAIGEGVEIIRRGSADIVITGGTDAMVSDFAIACFTAMRALPISYNQCPTRASRPFDLHREGFVFSEGAGALVLESLEHAEQRGARIYGEVAGHASSVDGFHLAALDPEAAGPIRAMHWALEDAGVSPDEVDYINAHGTSTKVNDFTETRAIRAVLGSRAYQVPISATKSMIGHAMGGAGALESIASVLTIHSGWIPPTINYDTPDPDLDLDYVPNKARRADVNTLLKNSFGLGGQNACLVLKRYHP